MTLNDTADPLDDAVLAARLFALAPATFKGMVLRGNSPAREALVAALGARVTLRRMPGHIDDERLLGGIDLAASLSAGRPIRQTGLIEEARGGVLLAGMAERMDGSIAGRLAQSLDEGQAALVLLDDATEPEEAPPASLTERLAFACDLSTSRRWQGVALAPAAGTLALVAPLGDDALRALAATADALGVESVRALIFAGEAARGLAALDGRGAAEKADLTGAVRLVLAPRATRLPPQEQDAPPEDKPPPPEGERDDQSDGEQQQQELDLSDILVEAAKAAIPADLLAQLAQGKAPRRSSSSGTGQKRKAATRGKPLGARPGMPRGGAKLALIDSLRAAVPWQAVRRREAGANDASAILMRKEDLRIRRFEERAARVTIFAVDASGSAAAARLAEAKGAVELMLGQAYVTRSEVALVAFRGTSAELILPPTRSLTRARRTLAELPGGGGTPLAMGLNAAREVAEAVIARGRSAALVILTDGRANIAADGAPGRPQAAADAEAAAKAIYARGIDALVVDISARPGPEGAALAAALGGRFLALPRADARMITAAINAVQPIGKAA
ncbi:magnesium chelatase subunit D [Erythromicrobium ramosum]|uniref:Magnesium chelatase subunit D n=1 Tax=Erythrobacter ramosus TaxID=35811 RepID=A0A6I4UPV1_9SPHN|nr:magnesium chelatase subunit D [Erythrobacter ramosus]MBB3777056.1 magnesium chelatase subunit D [Erythrobacter ramosus]MXP39804.1 magnesium chelatase subunit D [Erythrobacter ramosus]